MEGVMSAHRVFLAQAVLVVSMLVAGTSLAHAAFASPEDVVKALYGLYSSTAAKPSEGPYNGNCSDADSERKQGFPSSAKLVGQYLEPALARGYVRAKNLDADPFILGQDWCLRDLVITPGKNDGKKAIVTASFTNLGNASKVTYQLIKTAQGWLIYDLSSSDSASLRKEFKVRK
jgi:hypothetical protein